MFCDQPQTELLHSYVSFSVCLGLVTTSDVPQTLTVGTRLRAAVGAGEGAQGGLRLWPAIKESGCERGLGWAGGGRRVALNVSPALPSSVTW